MTEAIASRIPLRVEDAPLAVATHGIVKRYGKVTALAGLDLTVPENAFYVLVGPNGAGKSTAVRVLLDLVRADEGTASVYGLDTRDGARVRAQIGWVPERQDTLYGWMRVDRMLAAHAAYYPAWDATYAAHLSSVLGIRHDRRYGRLSKGEARRVQLLMALAHRPRLLLLDEPTDGLDPSARATVLGLIGEHLAEAPATVIVSTHLVYEVERLADHLGVLRDGLLVAQMRRDELDRFVRHYALDVPDAWRGPTRDLTVVRQAMRGREAGWIVWGAESEVVATLTASGAIVRHVAPVTLEDAAVALLDARDSEQSDEHGRAVVA